MRKNCQSPCTHVEPCNEEYVFKVKGVLAQEWRWTWRHCVQKV